jgi:hypothetical protein
MSERPPVLSQETLRAARIAEEALRVLLRSGQAPDPEAFAREYARAEARLDSASDAPRWGRLRPAADTRRMAGLLAAALAALAGALPPDASEGEACVDLAARILAGGDPLPLAGEVERAISNAAQAMTRATPVRTEAIDSGAWREALCEALRHLVALLPPASPAADDLRRVRTDLLRAAPGELGVALDRARRLLGHSLLGPGETPE